jgi:hypothetical protein
MKPEDITKRLHMHLMKVSDDTFKMFLENNVPEKVAFLSLCMSLARMTLGIGKDVETVSTFVRAYYKACVQVKERKQAAKSKVLN